MANDFESRPIKIDTQMSNFASTDDSTRPLPYHIKRVYWYNPTTAGHLLEILAASGDHHLIARCEVDGQSQWFDLDGEVWKDFKVSNLDSGTVYIYTYPLHSLRR